MGVACPCLLLILVACAALLTGRPGSARQAEHHDAPRSRKSSWGHAVLAARVPAELVPPRLLAATDIVPVAADADFEREYTAFLAKGERGPAAANAIGFVYIPNAGKAPRVRLRASLAPQRAEGVLIHEWGHVVWLRLLTTGERLAWVTLWNRAHSRGTLPSAYAGESAVEGFCEAFRAWLGPSRTEAGDRPLDSELLAFLDTMQKRRAPVR